MSDKRDKVGFTYSTDESKITELTGVRLRDYYDDLKLMVWAQKKANEIVQGELGVERKNIHLSSGHVKSPEVMGCEVAWPEDEEPWVSKPVIHDISEATDFEVPDPPDNHVVVELLNKAKEFYDLTGIKSTVGFEGPATTAALSRGIEAFYIDLIDSPTLAEKLIDKVTNAAIAWKEYHDAQMGIDPGDEIGLADDNASFMPPTIYEDMVLPYEREWYEAFPRPKRSLHICGDTTHILDRIAKLNLSSFDMGEMVDLVKAKKTFKDTYIWRIFDFKILRDGSEEDIANHTMEEIKKGSEGGNFGIHVEGWRGVPLAKVKIVKEAIDRYNS